MDHYDLIVIGSGPAGEKGAAQAAYFGKRVALVERAPHVGGAGINTGTVPSKTLRETALYFSGLRQRGLYGVDYSVKPDLTVQDFMYREQEVVRSLRSTTPTPYAWASAACTAVSSSSPPDRCRRARPGCPSATRACTTATRSSRCSGCLRASPWWGRA